MTKSALCKERCQFAADVGMAEEGYSCHHECQYINDDEQEIEPLFVTVHKRMFGNDPRLPCAPHNQQEPTMTNLHEGLKALGQSADNNAATYESAMNHDPREQFSRLERFPNPNTLPEFSQYNAGLEINIETPEFTSLCPITGQPDFATIKIRYRPGHWCVESKALKLYLLTFRNKGEFHEACVTRIGTDLAKLLNPYFLEVIGEFTPRGGIPIWPTFTFYGNGEAAEFVPTVNYGAAPQPDIVTDVPDYPHPFS